MQPYEIIAAPFTLYLAPAGSAFPAIDAVPVAPWVLVGTSGDRNYSDDGVTVGHNQTISQARSAGSRGPIRSWRTEESIAIALTLWDLTLEQYLNVMNGADLTVSPHGVGAAGFKKIGLSGGRLVTPLAALLRGVSSYDDSLNAQYEVPLCFQSGNPKPAFKKGVPAGLELEFTALEDRSAASSAERFGRLIIQDAVALPANAMLAEDGSFILAEDGSHINLEG